MMRTESGAVTVFALVLSMAMIVAAGLVLDGGRLLSARRQAGDIAGNAARAGAQAVDEHQLRSGRAIVDPVDGADAVAAYLAGTPATGTARIAQDAVSVTVRLPVRMLLLGAVGMDGTTVTAARQARAVRGVTRAVRP
jgi:hypothetical protein